ncbi:Cytochrome c biogenesis protein CcdA [Nocardioides alpinus]|uniref:Cytochrome c biogenesis protein CcdA n=1 Tax=Nocardioides alpinus TaxID=748909 RepID=A0A1I0YX38_9ACTN|nr:cytochrome c biogenesis CcdA family protein [Nocardioides alpinus]PKH43745.1 cytochrome c biogenesis protein CcdA [Nocardioides alpinus]SFB16788.1 Cytochrome c biogenesis protein CcdA [Nocardioides alpinus]
MGDTLALAVGAGMLAAVNPCGFALLPAYLSVLVLGDDSPGPARAVARALVLTAWMTVGFVAVFGVFGLVISPVASEVQQYLPWFTTVLGALLVLAGAWLLAGRDLPRLQLTRGGGKPLTRTAPAMVGFGMSYAAASLTCSIAPFLALVVASFRSGSTGDGVALFVAYSAGMGLLVGVAAVSVALARRGVVAGLRRTGRWVPRLSGILLMVVGAYVAWYGAWELRVLDGGDPSDPVIEAAARLQRTLADWVGRITP